MPSVRLLVVALSLASACTFELSRDLGPGDLRGTLVTLAADGSHAPVAGAKVSVRNAPVTVVSDAKGRFVVRALPAGTYDLSIAHTSDAGPLALSLRGLTLASVGNGKAEGRDLGELLLGAYGGIDVTLDGTVAADAQVLLDGVGYGRIQGNSVRFENLAPGKYVVSGLAGGAVVKSGEVTVKAAEFAGATLDFGTTGERLGTLTGNVRTAGNLSPDLVSITVVGTGTQPFFAGPDGTFVAASLPAGVYTILFEAPDALPTQVPFVVIAGDTELGDVLVLPADTDCANGGTGLGTTGDADADGTPDAEEPAACRCRPGTDDSDDNGVCDDAESTPPVTAPDRDHDGVPDEVDTCPDVANLGRDADLDGLDDACDPLIDSDDDGVADADDDCPGVRDVGADADSDGVDDACDQCPGAPDPTDGGVCPQPASWSVGFVRAADADHQAGVDVWLTEIGVAHDVEAVLPSGLTGTVTVRSTGAPVATITAVSGSSTRFSVTVPWVGTSTIEFTLTGSGGPQVKTLRILGVLDRTKAVFVDPNRDTAGAGTFDAPLADPVAALNALGPTTPNRHFYVRAGTCPNDAGVLVNTDAAHDRGAGRIHVFGGFDANWNRDPAVHRTELRSPSGPGFFVGADPQKGSLWLDGVTLSDGGGVRCNGGDLVVAQSFVYGTQGSAIDAIGCTGFLANSVLMGLTSSATVSWMSADTTPSNLRLFDNTVISLGQFGGPVNTGSYIGGEVVGNLFYDASDFPFSNVSRVMSDNVWAVPGALVTAPLLAKLAELDRAVKPHVSNLLTAGCPVGTDQGTYIDVSGLLSTGLYPLSGASMCTSTGELPSPADAQESAVFRLDRRLHPRHPDSHQRGSDERDDTDGDSVVDLRDGCPLDPESSNVFPCPAADMDFLPTSQLKLAVTTNGAGNTAQLTPGHRIPGVTFSYSSRDPSVATVDTSGLVTGVQVGSTVVQVTAFDPATSRVAFRSVNVEVRPAGKTYYVDLRATTTGDGRESTPFESWPDVQTLVSGSGGAAVNLLVAEIRSYDGQLMPFNWLPTGARVFGGYVRSSAGFERRLPVAETNLQPARNIGGSLEIPAGSPGDPAWKRVLDGVSVGTNGTTADAALRVGGPIVLSRVRVTQTYYLAPTALELGTGNVALVSSAVAFEASSKGGYSIVDIRPNASPVVLSNDLWRTYGLSSIASTAEVAAMFRIFGGNGSISGKYAANRLWTGDTTSRYTFFDLGNNGLVSPTWCYGNVAGPVAAEWHGEWFEGLGSTWSDLDTVASGNPVNASANTLDDGAAATTDFLARLESLPPPALAGFGQDTPAQGAAIDAAAPANWGRLPLDRDLRDRKRPATNAAVGAQEPAN